MTAGQDFVKKIRPIGAAMFLLLFALFLYICFSSGSNPLAGYQAPHDSAYYAQSGETLEELKTELETNVFPKLSGIEICSVSDGRLAVTIDSVSFSRDRAAILSCYDESLFEFISNSN
ncbi:MAG: hypothetical protein VB064_05825 [Oscillospiraceae bacterium]|nr:hypothetical protein [Oscillospiraceae bacterium]